MYPFSAPFRLSDRLVNFASPLLSVSFTTWVSPHPDMMTTASFIGAPSLSVTEIVRLNVAAEVAFVMSRYPGSALTFPMDFGSSTSPIQPTRIAVPSVATMTMIISSRGRPSIPPFLFILNSLFLSHILCVILTT